MKRSLFVILLLALSVAYAAPEDGLVAYWDGDSVTGNCYADEMGLYTTVNASGTVTCQNDGKVGRAINFTGVNGVLNASRAGTVTPTAFSFVAWVKPGAVGTTEEVFLAGGANSATSWFFYTDTYGGASYQRIRYRFHNGTESGPADSGVSLTNNTWAFWSVTYDGTTSKLYKDGVLVYNETNASAALRTVNNSFFIGGAFNGGTFTSQVNGAMDEVGVWWRALTADEITLLYNGGAGRSAIGSVNITGLNCTSCNAPYGDTDTPFYTTDTTPTFIFNTTVAADCRIGPSNQNFTTMGVTRFCTSGNGTTAHTCTLQSADALTGSSGYVYLACQTVGGGAQGSASTSGGLLVVNDINYLIDAGVQTSEVWPGATIYNDQQVYLRNLSGSQILTTVDRVVAYGNKRWLFSYTNTSAVGLFNLTPVVYSLELVNTSLYSIPDLVSAFINNTN